MIEAYHPGCQGYHPNDQDDSPNMQNTTENRENTPKGAAAKRPPPWGAAEGRACVFFISPRVFAYLGYHPSH